MHAGPHETRVIGIEKREAILEALWYFLPRSQNGIAVNCLMKLLYVDAL
jgi:hypothetical protein